MPLQNSGPISLGQIGGEYIDAAPHSMSEFRGRTQLPTGTISFSDFYGKSGKVTMSCVQGSKFYPSTGKGSFAQTLTGFRYDGSTAEFGSATNRTFNLLGRALKVDGVYQSDLGNIVSVLISGFGSVVPTQTNVWSTFTKNGVTLTASQALGLYVLNGGDSRFWSFDSAYAAIVLGNNVGTMKLV